MGNFRRVPVGIIGASGYGGVQLVRLLLNHPELELVYLGGETSAGKDFSVFIPLKTQEPKNRLVAKEKLIVTRFTLQKFSIS